MVDSQPSLLAKIKTLNETVWEHRISEPAVMDWLSNFQQATSPDERLHALFLLSNFMYFGSRQIRELLKAVYRDLYRYPIVHTIRKAHEDTVDSTIIDPLYGAELNKTRFLGVGNPSESGSHLLYYFRQENALPKELFIHSHRIFNRNLRSVFALRDPNISRYVFIDDFCGSGKQATEYSHDLVEAIKVLDPHISVSYYVLFATRDGISKVRSETAFDHVSSIFELDDSFRCFSPNSRFFKEAPPSITKAFCETMCRSYGMRMLPPEHALGFEDSQLLLGFHHNTPDNTLPIIWLDEHAGAVRWIPIFRRYQKLEWSPYE